MVGWVNVRSVGVGLVLVGILFFGIVVRNGIEWICEKWI